MYKRGGAYTITAVWGFKIYPPPSPKLRGGEGGVYNFSLDAEEAHLRESNSPSKIEKSGGLFGASAFTLHPICTTVDSNIKVLSWEIARGEKRIVRFLGGETDRGVPPPKPVLEGSESGIRRVRVRFLRGRGELPGEVS